MFWTSDGYQWPQMCEQVTCMDALPAGAGPGLAPDYEAMRPTFVQALKDAISHHHDGQCGYPEHLGWVENYERALDILERRPVLTCALPGPCPGASSPRWHVRAARAAGGVLLRIILGVIAFAAVITAGAYAVHGLILLIAAIP